MPWVIPVVRPELQSTSHVPREQDLSESVQARKAIAAPQQRNGKALEWLRFLIQSLQSRAIVALMALIDDVLIDRVFSPFAGWLKHQFGICQWRMSIACIDVSTAAYVAGIALTIAPKGMRDGIFVDLLSALLWLLIMGVVRDRANRQAASSLGVQTARLGEWIFRTVLLAMIPLSLFSAFKGSGICYLLSLVFLVVHLYFKAADTPPPRGRRQLAYLRG